MNPNKLYCCPGTLAKGFSTYSPGCLRNLFGGKKVNHVLSFEIPAKTEIIFKKSKEDQERISISNAQEKNSLVLEKNKLRLTNEDETGTYILKTIPGKLKDAEQVPVNEHLTMQLAKQVYGLNTVENAMIFLMNGTLAYISKRFDVKKEADGPGVIKQQTKSFATFAQSAADNTSADYKYSCSYEEIGLLIQKHLPAWRIEIEKFFSMVVFNYLFSNGDAHLKKLSLVVSSAGDYILSPAYDLINTRLHVDDTDFALDKGLFSDDYKSDHFKQNGHPSMIDFKEFANRIGIMPGRFDKIMTPFIQHQPFVETLVSRSFLSEANKIGYLLMYNARRNHLRT